MKKLVKYLYVIAVCVTVAFVFVGCLTTNDTDKKPNGNNIIQVEQSVSSSKGTVVEIYYPTRDYTIDEKDLTDADRYEKHAFVYLPAGYDANDTKTKYPIIFLMHGNGANEYTWGLPDEGSEIRRSLDNGIASGNVKKMIVVTPCGVADKTWQDNSNGSSWFGTINFAGELHNDLIPYMRQHFNIREGRENFAMAGFSMGAEQSLGIGIQQSLSSFSYFGAFSAIPFSIPSDITSPFKQPSDYIKAVEEAFPDENLKIKLLYMTCGTNDEFMYQGYRAYIKELPKWSRIEKFKEETIEGAGHDWDLWVNGFDHFIQMVFK